MSLVYHIVARDLVDIDMDLLRAAGLLKNRYEPKPRCHHFSGAVGGQCVVFAGVTVDFAKTKEELSSTVEVFDQYLEEWKALRTTGSPPKGLMYGGGCCVSPSGQLYVYGGYDGSRWCGGLYKLSSLEWRQLSSESDAGCPSPKGGCGITFFDEKKIAVIDGYGPPPDALLPGASFIKNKHSTRGYGWNNEMHVFDTEECKWLT